MKATRLFALQVEPTEEATPATDALDESGPDRVYLDLTPVKSFLHSSGSAQAQAPSPPLPHLDPLAEALPADPGPSPTPDEALEMSPETPELQVQAIPQQVSGGPAFLAPQLPESCLLPPKADAAGESGA